MANEKEVYTHIAMNKAVFDAVIATAELDHDTIEYLKEAVVLDDKNTFDKKIRNVIGDSYEEIIRKAKLIYHQKKRVEPISGEYVQQFDDEGNAIGLIPYAEEEAKPESPRRPANIKLDNFIDNARTFQDEQPFFYDEQGTFWFWNHDERRWRIVDDVQLMISFDEILGMEGQTVSSHIKRNYMEAFRRVGRQQSPKHAPKHFIQFKDQVFCIKSGHVYTASPKYWFCNPLPWAIGETDETPVMDRLITEWVGEKYVPTMYEILAYCCYTSYPIQMLFCFYGQGRNGKTSFLNLITKFVGRTNISSTDLDLLVGNQSSRFESIKLYKRLVCLLGETNFQVISNTTVLKKLTGTDLMGFERKGKEPFDEYNYAKIIIASNSPPISEDTTDGWYRRWMLIDFSNQFPEGKDVLQQIPDIEYSNLAKKVTRILPQLIERGSFTNQGTVETRKRRYIMASNPLSEFIHNHCTVGDNEYVLYSEVYLNYIKYLQNINRRTISKREFSKYLVNEGLDVKKTWRRIDGQPESISAYWVEGIALTNPIRSSSNVNPMPPSNVMESILDYIGDREVSIEEITAKFFSDNDYACEPILQAMKEKGELFEPRRGHLKKL